MPSTGEGEPPRARSQGQRGVAVGSPGPQAALPLLSWLRLLALLALCRCCGSTELEVEQDSPEAATAPRRVALCFYGVTRSLRYTLPSIKTRLIDAIRDGGMEVDLFVHTYDMREYENYRDGNGAPFDYSSFAQDFKTLNATRSLVTNQDDLDLAWPEPASISHYDWAYPKSRIGVTVRNIFRAYWSMAMVWGLMAQYGMEEGFEFDAVILARPDVWYLADIDLPGRTYPLPDRVVYIPSFNTNHHAVNDKFAYGSVTTMRVVMHRIAAFLDPDAAKIQKGVHSEWVFKHHLDVNGISPSSIEFPLARVRMTGEVAVYDYPHLDRACGSGKDPGACEIVERGYTVPHPTATSP